MLSRALRGGETIIADKGYAGREFAAELGATVVRPSCKDEPGQAPVISGIRQRVESILQIAKDILGASVTAPAPCTTCVHGSLPDCSRSPPA